MNNKSYKRTMLAAGVTLVVLLAVTEFTYAGTTYTWSPTSGGTYGWNNTITGSGIPAAMWDESVSDLGLFPGKDGDLTPGSDNDVANMYSKNRTGTQTIRMNGVNAFISELDIGDSDPGEADRGNMIINDVGGGSIIFKKSSGPAILHAIGPHNRTEQLNAPVTFASDTIVIVEQAAGTGGTNFLQISGAVTGSGNLTILPLNGSGVDSSVPFAGGTGASVFFYDGDMSGYSGTINFDATGTNGTVNNGDRVGLLGAANAQQMSLNLTGPSDLGKVGIFSLELGALNGTGGLIHPYGNSGTPTLKVGYKSNLADSFDGVITGGVSFEKVGTGTQSLGGANTYTGDTTVSDGTLEINGSHTGGNAYIVASNGKLVTNTIRANALSVDGIAEVRADGGAVGASMVESLTIGGAGQLNLKNNDLVVGTGGLLDVRSQIKLGVSGLSDTAAATGITSDMMTVGVHGFGYALGDDVNRSPLIGGPDAGGTLTGLTYDADSVLVKFTYRGDADLDGDADLVDLSHWAASFSGSLANPEIPTTLWTQGDWDYDGDTDLVDLSLWSANFTGNLNGGGLSVYAPNASEGAISALAQMGITTVPEPGSFLLLVVGAGSVTVRTWRRRRRIALRHTDACNLDAASVS